MIRITHSLHLRIPVKPRTETLNLDRHYGVVLVLARLAPGELTKIEEVVEIVRHAVLHIRRTVILPPHPGRLRGGPLGVGTMIVTGIDETGIALTDHIAAAA